jgi:hypothetical protein
MQTLDAKYITHETNAIGFTQVAFKTRDAEFATTFGGLDAVVLFASQSLVNGLRVGVEVTGETVKAYDIHTGELVFEMVTE